MLDQSGNLCGLGWEGRSTEGLDARHGQSQVQDGGFRTMNLAAMSGTKVLPRTVMSMEEQPLGSVAARHLGGDGRVVPRSPHFTNGSACIDSS